jgi:hypothetical protein
MTPARRIAALALIALALYTVHNGGIGGIGHAPDGPRGIAIVRESSEDTSDFARILIGLRSGDSDKYLREHKHQLVVFDKDDSDENGNRVPELKAMEPVLKDVEQPALVVTELSSGKVLHAGKCPTTSPAAVLDVVKGTGG